MANETSRSLWYSGSSKGTFSPFRRRAKISGACFMRLKGSGRASDCDAP